MARNRGGGTAGFSLLEAVVALTVVGLTAVAVLGAFGSELRTAEKARTALEAEALAQDRLALARLLSAAELAPLPDSIAKGKFPVPFEQFEWSTKVSSVSQNPELYDVVVFIRWNEGSYPLQSRVYRPVPRIVQP